MNVQRDSKARDGDDLDHFIVLAKAHGVEDSFVVTLLRQSGYPERRVYRSYAAYYAKTLGVPLPVVAGHAESARDAFYYVLNFVTLGFWTLALGQLFYILIDRAVPDVVSRPYYVPERNTAWQIAAIIIAFPAFLFIHRIIQRELRRRPELYDSAVRKWITYVALIIAAIISLMDAIWFLQAALNGELTSRFILRSLTLIVLSGGVFSYYFTTMARKSGNADDA